MIARAAWTFRDGMLLVGLLVLSGAATWSVWRDIAEIAIHSEEQSHILLAPIIAVWLAWVRRERFRLCKPGWSILGPLGVCYGWLMAWFGYANGFDIGQHLGSLIIVISAAGTVIGFDPIRRFLPAFVALLFVLPVPGRVRQEIAIPLQEVTAKAAHYGMDLFGVPVVQMGNVLRINGHDVAVAEACNGMRMVSALGLVAFAFVFSVPMRNSVRILLLAASPLIAVLVNVIRLVPTVLLYGYADSDLATMFHDLSGWAMLFVALGFLWMILAVLRWIEVPIAPYAVAKR